MSDTDTLVALLWIVGGLVWLAVAVWVEWVRGARRGRRGGRR